MLKEGEQHDMMKVKVITALLVSFVFAFSVVGISEASGTKQIKGTVTKVDGNKIIVKNAASKEITVEIKVGDIVTIKSAINSSANDSKPIKEPVKKKKAIEGC